MNRVIGGAGQLLNTITGRFTLPIPMLPSAPIGDLFEPVGAVQRTAATKVEAFFESWFNPANSNSTKLSAAEIEKQRIQRPLLKTFSFNSTGTTSTNQLTFSATANVDWGARGRESQRIAIYLNGRYHSSVTVMSERSGKYKINLGSLPPGNYHVELRAIPEQRASQNGVASFNGLKVSKVATQQISGLDALIQKHAPILELRDVGPSGTHSTSYSDAPVLIVPAVTSNADGSITIDYRVVFTNEEGGTKLPDLMLKYGRAADLEPAYSVRIAPNGQIIEAKYQAALHQWKRFDGERVGSRPVLRVASSNNIFSARLSANQLKAERWSETPIAVVTAHTSDFEVMKKHPWTWTLMAKELIREGKALLATDAVRGSQQIGDPRKYVYVGALTDALRGAIISAGGLELVTDNGRRVFARANNKFASGGGYAQGALELPRGVEPDTVRAVALLGVEAIMLDQRFEMRELANVNSLGARISA